MAVRSLACQHLLLSTSVPWLPQDRNMLGNRYVELFPSNRDEANMDGRR